MSQTHVSTLLLHSILIKSLTKVDDTSLSCFLLQLICTSNIFLVIFINSWFHFCSVSVFRYSFPPFRTRHFFLQSANGKFHHFLSLVCKVCFGTGFNWFKGTKKWARLSVRRPFYLTACPVSTCLWSFLLWLNLSDELSCDKINL